MSQCTSFLGSAIILMHAHIMTQQWIAGMWLKRANDNRSHT